MTLLTYYRTEDGVYRLLNAMFDVGCYNNWSHGDISFKDAAIELQELFRGYRKLLRQAYSEAVPWWEGTVAAERGPNVTEEVAIAEAFDKRYAGPASDPKVVWVVRLVWLECWKRNERLHKNQRVRPEYLMVQWLIDAGEEELVRLLACMPYWPLGLDEKGNWC